MSTLTEAVPAFAAAAFAAAVNGAVETASSARGVTVLDALAPRSLTGGPVAGLSRVRGGTFSSTVDVIRFADGSTAHTDLIRLNPNIDAYSVDFAGTSPRQLSHYREASWRHAPAGAAATWRREITHILASSYPNVSTAELTQRLREAGYPVGAGAIREHEAIAATQAAIWRLTNGLELDTRALDEPVRAQARIGDHPSARFITPDDGGQLNWHTPLPAGQTVYLELELAGQPQLEAFGFGVGARTGRHQLDVRLERSRDGYDWQPVSRSVQTVVANRPGGRRVSRRLGFGATLSNARATFAERGYRHYRLAATGPADRDGMLELRDVRLELAAGSRFRNNERIVFLYDLLLAQAAGQAPAVRRNPVRERFGEVLGPFMLADAAATVTMKDAHVVDAEGSRLWGPLNPGTPFFLRRAPHATSASLEVRVQPQRGHARVLIGSRTPGGPGVFTPLVSLGPLQDTPFIQRTIVLESGV